MDFSSEWISLFKRDHPDNNSDSTSLRLLFNKTKQIQWINQDLETQFIDLRRNRSGIKKAELLIDVEKSINLRVIFNNG